MDIYAALVEPKIHFVLISPYEPVGSGFADLGWLGSDVL